MSQYGRFLKNFVRSPFSVGAVAPSSRHLARRMVEDMDLDRANTVVELGPGTGAFTRTIEESISSRTLYLALELNAEFASTLSEAGFERARIIHDSAENIGEHLAAHERTHADSILCGLPWATFPEDLQGRILDAVTGALEPGGKFCSFAYIHSAWFPTARKFHGALRGRFRSVRATPVVWRNLPPAFVYRCEK